MIISYKWLMDYLPVSVEPEKLSRILNSIGLEVESFDDYEEVKGGLEGLIIGKVLEVTQHPNADKLSLNPRRYWLTANPCRLFAAHLMWLPDKPWWLHRWMQPFTQRLTRR